MPIIGQGGGGAGGAAYKGLWAGLHTTNFDGSTLIPPSFVYDAPGATIVAMADAGPATVNALRFRTILDNQATSFIITDTFLATTLTIRSKTSSESGFDYFRVYLDGTQQFQASGIPTVFSANVITIPAGSHVLKFEYSKDSSGSAGDDTAYISELTFDSGPGVYASGDTVMYGGAVWVCTTAATLAVPGIGTDWKLVEPAPLGIATVVTNYVATNADFSGEKIISVSNAAANTITVPAGLTGKGLLTLVANGIGVTTLVPATGVTINSAGGVLTIKGQYSVASLIPTGADTYLLVGGLG